MQHTDISCEARTATVHTVSLDRLLPSLEREMRVPLAALTAASGMLAEQLGAGHPGAGFARLIRREVARVQDAMSDLTGLALPLPSALSLVNLTPILADMVNEFGVPAQHNGVALFADIPARPFMAWGDADGLRTALGKIVRYELESMPGGGKLAIQAGTAPDPGGRSSRVMFSDTGPHLPVDLLAAAFNPFVTTAGRRSGMGLALCRRIIEHAGGIVTARNNPEGGLVIEVRLQSRNERRA